MSLSLSPELERLIEEKVESGDYDSVEDVVSDAMRLLCQRNDEDAAKLDALRQEIQKGIDDLENGRYSPINEVFARLKSQRGMLST